PVVFRKRLATGSGALDVTAAGGVNVPLYPRKVDAPLGASARRHRIPTGIGERTPRNRQLHRPTAIPVTRIVERPVEGHRDPQPVDVPAVVGVTAFAVWPGQEEIPHRGQLV